MTMKISIVFLFALLFLPAFSNGQYASTFEWFSMGSALLVDRVSARSTSGSLDDVWYISTAASRPYRWNGASWDVKSSGIPTLAECKQVAASTDGWAWMVTTPSLLSSTKNVYRFNAPTGSWELISLNSNFNLINSVSRDSAIGVKGDGTVWTWIAGTATWSQVGNITTAAYGSMGIDGDMWIVDNSGAVLRWVSGAWVSQSTSPAMKSVEVHKTGRIVAVQITSNAVYMWKDADWMSLNFASTSVSITDRKVYSFASVLVNLLPQWALLLDIIPVTPFFEARLLSVRGTEVWALSKSGSAAYRHNGTDWEQKSTTTLLDIASNSDGLVWGCSIGQDVVRFNGTAFVPAAPLPTSSCQSIASGADSSNTAFVSSNDYYNCYEYDGSAWSDRCPFPKNYFLDTAMGVDGRLWQVKSFGPYANVGLRWNATTSKWDPALDSTLTTYYSSSRIDAYNASRLVAVQNTNVLVYWNGDDDRSHRLNILGYAITISDSKIYFNGDYGVAYVEF